MLEEVGGLVLGATLGCHLGGLHEAGGLGRFLILGGGEFFHDTTNSLNPVLSSISRLKVQLDSSNRMISAVVSMMDPGLRCPP